MIKITKLHLMLMIIIVFIAGIYVYQVQQERQRQVELAAIEAEREAERRRFEEERSRQELLAKKKQLSIEAIAVAGEYIAINKKEKKDSSTGQATLRQAKENLAQNDFDKAYELAHRSIAEFKSAPFLPSPKPKKLYYKVRSGDSLWKIAKMPRHYGKGSLWVRIWRANKKTVPDFSLIRPRQVLYIPKNQKRS